MKTTFMCDGLLRLAVLGTVTVVVGCAAGADGTAQIGEASDAVACASPRSFGATPNDGIDDRAALQAALSSGCSPLVLEAGTYNIATPASPRAASILSVPANVELVGAGDTTVLKYAGDAGGHDWYGLHLTSHSTVHHLKIDTAALVGTEEQTHAIRVDGPATGPLIEYVTFNHPQRGLSGGDCVQLVGYPTTLILAPVIRNNNFAVCDRSGVAFHSGVHGGQISNNTFSNTGDQDIDGEGTGDVDGLEIGPGNQFATGAGAQSSIAMELQAATNIHVHHNTFNGRGLFLYGCSGCELDHDTITQSKAGASGALEVQKDSATVYIHDETVVRAASAGDGAVLRFMPHGSGTPSGVTIANNSLTQNTGASTVDAMGIVGLHLDGNQFHYNGAAVANYAVSAVGSAGDAPIRTTDISLASNTFAGGYSAVLRVSGSYGGTGTVSLTGNTATGAAHGLRCENITTGSQVLGPITYTGNTLPAAECGTLVP